MMMTTKELEKKLYGIDFRLSLIKTDDGKPSSIYFGESIRSDTFIYDFGIKGYGVQGFIKENCLRLIPDKIHDLNKLLDEYYEGRNEIPASDSKDGVDSTDPEKPAIKPIAIANNHNQFKKYTDKLAETLLEKNTAYGDSFSQSVDDYGLKVIGIRLSDKYNRIKHLVNAGSFKENDESLEDTLLDTAGYSILALKYLEEHRDEIQH